MLSLWKMTSASRALQSFPLQQIGGEIINSGRRVATQSIRKSGALSMFSAAEVFGLVTPTTSKACSVVPAYEEAIKELNRLQSNAATIQKSVSGNEDNIAETWEYLQRIGIDSERLEQLSVIHVAGTKGKGSTCAFTESILRSFGLKTGFFSSPHLILVTERIRINGIPIKQEDFAKHFWNIYYKLDAKKKYETDMPAYFKFLTILAFHIFLEEGVDVAIIEVGIGGELDSTNALQHTKTVGITSLGLDHTQLLGNTLPEIAWQKAGIIKKNSNIFTSPQPSECMQVIEDRTKEKNANLYVAPDFVDYKWPRESKLKMNNKVQKVNASLAIQLAYDWLRQSKIEKVSGFIEKFNENGVVLDVPENVLSSIEECFWPGRGQIIKFHNKTVYLDGAHTFESLKLCLKWFREVTMKNNRPKCFLFNAIGDRDSKSLLKVLNHHNKYFSQVLFVPNIPCEKNANKNEEGPYGFVKQVEKAKMHAALWAHLTGTNTEHLYFESILQAFKYIDNQFKGCNDIDILVTGSMHLIGATALALEYYDKQLSY